METPIKIVFICLSDVTHAVSPHLEAVFFSSYLIKRTCIIKYVPKVVKKWTTVVLTQYHKKMSRKTAISAHG